MNDDIFNGLRVTAKGPSELFPEVFENCWLCNAPNPTEAIVVECETPNGKPCAPKTVKVHFGCLMDIDP